LSLNKLKKTIQKKLNKINKNKIKIIDNYNPIQGYTYKDVESYITKNQFNRFLRFIIPHSLISNYLQVYIGDIDIFYINKLNIGKSSLFDREENIINNTQLSFNNISRINEKSEPTFRLGGLHYISVEKYYKLYQNKIKKIQQDKLAFLELVKYARSNIGIEEYLRDEHLLFSMLIERNKIKIMTKLLNNNKRRIYGLHFSDLRNKIKNINSFSLFQMDLSNQTQRELLSNIFYLIVKNKYFYFFFKQDFISLILYYYKLVLKNHPNE